jgi:ligand-binding sensor domain-containing protein
MAEFFQEMITMPNTGLKQYKPLTGLQRREALASTSSTTISDSTTSEWITTQAGVSTNETLWIDRSNMGTSTLQTGQPWRISGDFEMTPIGEMVNLTKTADGEFVLTGTGDYLTLLMEYFLQSPELWLRLAAMRPEKVE